MTAHLPAEQRRRLILDAVGQLMLRHGVTGVTMSAVAEEADISRRLVYDHFADLSTLLSEYFLRTIPQVLSPVASWEQTPPVPGDGIDALGAMLRIFIGFDAEQRMVVSLIRTPHASPELSRASAVVEESALGRWRQSPGLVGLSDGQILMIARIMTDLALELSGAVASKVLGEDVAIAVLGATARAVVGNLHAQR